MHKSLRRELKIKVPNICYFHIKPFCFGEVINIEKISTKHNPEGISQDKEFYFFSGLQIDYNAHNLSLEVSRCLKSADMVHRIMPFI